MTKKHSKERYPGLEWQRAEYVNSKVTSECKECKYADIMSSDEPCVMCIGYEYDKFEPKVANPSNDIAYSDEIKQAAIDNIMKKAHRKLDELVQIVEDQRQDQIAELKCNQCRHDGHGIDAPPCDDCTHCDKFEAIPIAGCHANNAEPIGGWHGDTQDTQKLSPGFGTLEPASNQSILSEAYSIINGERQDSYGTPEDSFQIIADLWNIKIRELQKQMLIEHGLSLDDYNLKPLLKPLDVADMMDLMKSARLMSCKRTRDSYRDKCGYNAIAADRLMDNTEDDLK